MNQWVYPSSIQNSCWLMFFFSRGPYNAWYYGDCHNPWAVLINQHLYRIEFLNAAHFVAIWVVKMNHRIVLDCVAPPIFSQAHPKGGDGKWERMSSWVCQSKWPDICAICSLILVNLIVTEPVNLFRIWNDDSLVMKGTWRRKTQRAAEDEVQRPCA